jgi:hypothetical protein
LRYFLFRNEIKRFIQLLMKELNFKERFYEENHVFHHDFGISIPFIVCTASSRSKKESRTVLQPECDLIKEGFGKTMYIGQEAILKVHHLANPN